MMQKRWQDWAMLLFGLWLFFSPFLLSYSSLTSIAAWNSSLLGFAIAFFAMMALAIPRLWEEWINLVLGLWLIIAPFVLGFSADNAATWNHVVLGVLISADALWAIVQRPVHRTV